jgi:NAD(P)-dependent dehydrogenase (short-subunit alcohol dehydrogenase family)
VQLLGSVETFTDDQWRWVLDVNVAGTARTGRTFLPLLCRAPTPKPAVTTSSCVFDPASAPEGLRLAAHLVMPG